MYKKQVGKISAEVIKLLNLPNIQADTPIYIGTTNISHMKSSHLNDYNKYGADIPSILASPDYVGSNPKDNSIEYVKEYKIDNEYVKVAVRISSGNNYFARSIYILNNKRVLNFIKKGTLKKV